MECSKCGRPIPDSDSFCPVCGSPNPNMQSKKEAEQAADVSDDRVALLSIIFGLIALISFPYPYFSVATAALGMSLGVVALSHKNLKVALLSMGMNILMFLVSGYYVVEHLFF